MGDKFLTCKMSHLYCLALGISTSAFHHAFIISTATVVSQARTLHLMLKIFRNYILRNILWVIGLKLETNQISNSCVIKIIFTNIEALCEIQNNTIVKLYVKKKTGLATHDVTVLLSIMQWRHNSAEKSRLVRATPSCNISWSDLLWQLLSMTKCEKTFTTKELVAIWIGICRSNLGHTILNSENIASLLLTHYIIT